jgi:hypothetical protein
MKYGHIYPAVAHEAIAIAGLRICRHVSKFGFAFEQPLDTKSMPPENYFSALRYLVDQRGGGIGTLAARNRDGAMPLHVLCGASTLATARLALPVEYLIQSFPGSVAMSTDTGLYPFMIAADNASLCVVYEIVRANPVLAIP